MKRLLLPFMMLCLLLFAGKAQAQSPVKSVGDYFYISSSGWVMWAGAPSVYPDDPAGPGDECVINTIALEGLVEPVFGAAPSFNITTSDDSYTIGAVQWLYVNPDDATQYGTMQEGDVFNNEDVEYYLMAAVYPAGDCEFGQSVVITINGEESLVNADVTEYNAEYNAYLVVSTEFTVSENPQECVINYVNITGFEEPVYGGVVSTTGLSVDADNYEITSAGWYEITSSNPLDEGSTFGEGSYYLYVELAPSDECTVDTDNLTFAFNGETDPADSEWCGYESSYAMFYMNTILYNLTNPSTTLLNDFENDLGDWTLIDADGDGNNWKINTSSSYVHGGLKSLMSESYTTSALDPDNYVVSPLLTIKNGDTLTFYEKQYSPQYPEHFGVAVSTTSNTDPSAFTMVTGAEWTGSGSTWNKREVDLSAYAGQQIYVAIRHYESSNMWRFYIDDISIVNTPAKSGNRDIARLGFKNISGKTVNKNVVACLNKQIASLNLNNTKKAHRDNAYAWGFDESDMEGWTSIDADGDGYGWVLASASAGVYHKTTVDITGQGHNDSYDFMVSGSYTNAASQALTPDNYLVSPLLEIDENHNVFTFWGCTADDSYPTEHFGVAVSTDGTDFTTLQEWDMTAKKSDSKLTKTKVVADKQNAAVRGQNRGNIGEWHNYTVDLSEYEGQSIYVAIRHFNCTNMFLLYIDDIELTTADVLTGYNLYLDGELVAEGINDLDYYMQEAEDFTDGTEHTTRLEAVYKSGATLDTTKTWTYMSGDHFTGSPSDLDVVAEGNEATLTWELPVVSTKDILYTFDDGNVDGLTIIDNNADGNSFSLSSSNGVDGGACAYIKYSYPQPNNDDYLIMPMVIPTENSVFSFDAASYSSSYGLESFEAVISVSGNESAEYFSTILGSDDAVPTDYQHYSYSLSEYAGQEVYVAVHCTSPDVHYFLVDNLSVTNASSFAIGAVVYRDGEIIAKLRNGETSYTDEFDGDMPEYCVRIIQDGSMDEGVYYALAEKQCFEETPQVCVIDSIAVEGFVEPAVGVTVGDINITTSADNYSVLSVEWYDNEDLTMTALADDYEFEAGHSYYMFLSFQLNEGCSLDDEYTVYVNEDASIIDPTLNFFYEGVLNTYSVDFEVEEGPQDECPAPTNLTYTLNGGELTISWDASTMDDPAYLVYRSEDGENYSEIAFIEETTYTCGLFAEGTYYYKVTALGDNCESEPALTPAGADHIEVVYTPAAPCTAVAPINLNAEVDGENVILTWEMPEIVGPISYDFEDGLDGWTTFEGAESESSWLHSDDNPGGHNYTGLGNEGSDGFAMSYSFIDYVGSFQADNYLVSPEKYTIEEGTQLTFFYDFANDEYPDYFTVEVSTASNNTASDFTPVWAVSAKGGNNNHAKVRKAEGTRYENWRMVNIDLSAYAGQEVWIAFHHYDYNMYEVWIDDVTIGVVNKGAKDGGNLTFNVYRAVGNGSYELIAENVEDLTYTDEGLAEGTYQYYVTSTVATDTETCESDPSNTAEATIEPVVYTCEAPTNFASSLEGNELTLSWNAVSDPDAVYAVYATIDGLAQDAEVVTETSVTYTLNEGSTYYYQVTAMMTLPDQTFCESDPALTADGNNFIEITFTPVTTCVAPVDLVVTVAEEGTNDVVLAWDMDADVIVNGFRIYRSNDGENYAEIATVTETTYTEETPGDGTFYYQVTALNALAGGECESEPAMDVNNEFNYVVITVDGINDLSNLIKLYPNPTKSNVNIEADNMSRIVIVNTLGQVVYDATVSSNNTVINMSNFGAGLYMVNITTDNGVIVKRVTVAK